MIIAVTGTKGQVVTSLMERATAAGARIVPVGRPALDLSKPETVRPTLSALKPDAIVNAAAYTSVDQAEANPELAQQINAIAAGEVASVAKTLGVPIIQLSTDYVFDGEKNEPYEETDRTNPQSVYGRTKLAGEEAVASKTPNHAILRTSWVYSPFGKNFVRTILKAAETRGELTIVSDQRGSPTSAFDVADGVIAVAKSLVANPNDTKMRGIFHMTADGDTTWAGFGTAIFAASMAAGGPSASVRYITSAEYPQAAKRPANSRLDCSRIAKIHGVRLPDWHRSLKNIVDRIVQAEARSGVTA